MDKRERDKKRLALYTETDRATARFGAGKSVLKDYLVPVREENYVSITRVGLAETKNFAAGYEAIFGKKKSSENKKTKAAAQSSTAKKKKKTSKKK